ncbi:hypothetical protein FNV43_RR24337 [Rhamnella rubrinervis]|uniref:Uncharacterized protein n=1 Tax=Rhamnella rubrinervis TaxID=2594499 RepID=A0A8K0DLJ8_9ROSA|nr:hypothetical protein FNV43_RR24337 [Rhamnella rubrinervis]
MCLMAQAVQLEPPFKPKFVKPNSIEKPKNRFRGLNFHEKAHRKPSNFAVKIPNLDFEKHQTHSLKSDANLVSVSGLCQHSFHYTQRNGEDSGWSQSLDGEFV